MPRLIRPMPSSYDLSRRELLKLGASSVALCFALPACDQPPTGDSTCNREPPPNVPLPKSDWIRTARIAGLAAYGGATICDLSATLDQMAAERVSVVEIDPDLSLYLTDDQFKQQLDLCDLAARACHQRGMRAVVYYPMLESLTDKSDKTTHTMFKDHPDWVQISIDGKPNYFVGGQEETRVFWVAPGTESAWLCPSSGYVDYFAERVAVLAKTALDGLWGDVPLLSNIAGNWPCVNATCKAKFKKDTGLSTPTKVDWSDPVFRRWVNWRHHLIHDFEQHVLTRAKAVRADFELIVETVTMDYSSGTVQGLDGAAFVDGDMYRVWEVDAVSDGSSMRNANIDDWFSMAIMMKHARACSSPRPAWIFCYGSQEDDAERVMALAIAAGCNPYETKIPETNTSVGSDYRKRMYGWLEANPNIYASQSVHQVAVLYTSASRDFLDNNKGNGLYTSADSTDPLWWSSASFDSAKALDYLGDYRGASKILLQNHVPFDVIVASHVDAPALARYRLVVAPSPVALSDALVTLLLGYVSGGGTLLFTGTDAGTFDESGVARAQTLLKALAVTSPARGWTQKTIGKGSVVFTPDRAGRTYFNTGDASVAAQFTKALPAPQIVTDAPAEVIVEMRAAADGTLLVLFANLHGLGSKGFGMFTPEDVSFSVSLSTDGKSVSKVVISKPDAGTADQDTPFTIEGDKVKFAVAVHAVTIATLHF